MTRPIVLDVDPGCDDAAMLALALASDDLDVVGVTTVAGNATLPHATRNVRYVLERMDRNEVPVVAGCDRPLVRSLETAEHVHGEGGLPGALPAPADDGEADQHAVPFLLERSREIDDLTLVATGPQTNVAVALGVDPALPDRLDSIRVMGGAARVGGNVTAAAEYNFHADPEAATRVVCDGSPHVIGLDVTERAILRPGTIESLIERDGIVRTIAGWLAYDTPEAVEQDGIDSAIPLHDPAVVVDLLGDVLTYEEAALEVDHGSGPSRGNLIRDDRPERPDPNAAFAVDIDVAAFRSCLLDLLDGFE